MENKMSNLREDAEQTDRALWYWSLSLQAKVLYAWRTWVADRHRKQYRLARAADFYRDQLLRESANTYCSKDTALLAPNQSILPLNQHFSTHSACSIEVKAHNVEEEYGEEQPDPTSPLTRELLSIRQDMERFQQDRKQLQVWQRLREVLEGWLQSSGEEDQMEKETVCQELKELEERIRKLSADLAKGKPEMGHHAKRIQHLKALLHKSAGDILSTLTEERVAD